MGDLAPLVQTDKQPKIGLEADEMAVGPILESLGAWQPTEESTTPSAGLGDNE